MAIHESKHGAAGGRGPRTQTKTLGVLVAVMVVAGVVALVMTLFGSSSDSSKGQAANEPSGSQVGNQSSTSSSASASPSARTSSVAPSPASVTPAKPASPRPATTKPKTGGSAAVATKVVKYTVKRGDNLTLIASWYHQRGYGLVYDWNKSVIGRNPNLIHPGQTIIVSLKGDKMTVSAATK